MNYTLALSITMCDREGYHDSPTLRLNVGRGVIELIGCLTEQQLHVTALTKISETGGAVNP